MKPVLLLLFFLSLFLSPAVSAEGLLREKIKDRLMERMAERSGRTGSADKAPASGRDRYSISVNGLNRAYLIHVPPSYSPGKPVALILAFHGGGGDMDYMARDGLYGLITKSDKENFIVVFPNGYSKFSSGKFATWNAGACCGDARDKNIDDVGFVKAMLADIQKRFNIDPDRIFATGMSNGGMMAERLACEMPGTFKAVASVAGTDNTLTCKPSRPVSVLNIHALNDDHVLFNGGAGSGSFKDPSKVNNFTSVPETVSRWVTRNDCDEKPERILSKPEAYCDVYETCAGGAKVQLCVTEAGGHSWPGGHKPRGEAPSKALSANDEMWKFFQSLN